MKKYLVIICLMVGLTASAQNGEVFSVLKLEPQATAPTNAFWTNGSLYRGTDGTIYHKKDGSWEPLGGTTTVINTLTSTSTTSALSAAQGKVLKDGLDLKADDNAVVKLTGDQTVDGTKIFGKQLRLDYTLGSSDESNSPLQIALATSGVVSATPPAGFGGIYFNNNGEIRFQTGTEGAGDGANLGLEFDQLTATKDLIFTDSDITWGGTSLLSGGGGTGDVTAASAFGTDNRLIRSDGTGKGVQSSGITISDIDAVTGVSSLSATSTISTPILQISSYIDGVNELRLTPDNSIGSTTGKNSYGFKTGDIAYLKRVNELIGLGLDFNALTADKNLVFSDSDITWGGTSLLGGGGANNDLYTYEELTGDITLDATDFDSGKKVFYNSSSTNYTVTVPDVASAGEKVLFKQRGSGAIIIETPTIEIKTIDSTATVGLSKDPFGYDPMGSWEYYSSSFGKYLPITIQSSQVSGSSDLTNMPVLINLDHIDSEIMDADGTNDALNGGGDIRFYEDIAGTSPLAIEVVQFVTNATEGTRRAQIWVKIPTLSYDTDTVIYMGFGNGETSQPAADSTYGSEAVWSDFAFVSHDTHSDSSGNTMVTDNVTASSTSPFGGISGDFTGSSNNNNASLSHADLTGGLTVMTWANTTNTTGYLRALHLHDGTNEIQLMKGGGEGNYYFFSESNGTGTVVRSSATFSASTWEFYALTHTAFKTNQKIYKAGVDVTTSSAEGVGAGLTTEGIFMASRNNPSNGYNGYLSEVMVLEQAWSADKIKTLYNNLNSPSTFAIEGTIVE